MQIVRVTAGENVLGSEQVLSAGDVRNTFNLVAEVSDRVNIYVFIMYMYSYVYMYTYTYMYMYL